VKGAHDMGGVQGYGPIKAEPESEEPLFHDDWERRAFAMTLASGMLGKWTLDGSRYARERQTPEQYLANSYYETWTQGLETLLLESGLITQDELESGTANTTSEPVAVNEQVARKILGSGGPTLMDIPMQPDFQVGDKVRVKSQEPDAHTRAPAYVRGHVGVVEGYHGVHVFADAHAIAPDAGGERRGEPLYSVRFTARELWGNSANEHDTVLVDLWQPYLEGP
jgi:nitrile hydratase subunit beta